MDNCEEAYLLHLLWDTVDCPRLEDIVLIGGDRLHTVLHYLLRGDFSPVNNSGLM
jgi:hypothetical protein